MNKSNLCSIRNTLSLLKPSRAILLLLMILFVYLFSFDSSAQTNTWNGSSNDNWNNTANWSLNLVPTNAHDVVIPKVATDPIIYGTAVAKSVTINSQSLLTLNPGTSTARLSISGNFTNNGTCEVESGTLNIFGSLTNNGTLRAVSGTINISGSWTNTNNFKSGTGIVNFVGTSAQTINGILDGNNGTFYNLTFNGLGGSWTLVTTGFLWISNKLTMTNGIVNTTSIIDISNTATASISGGSATSFVNGRIKRKLNSGGSTYHFPVGSGTTYLPFSLVGPTGTGNITAEVQAFTSNSGGTANFTTIGSLSTTECWSLLTTGNFINSRVSLTRPTAIDPFDAIAGSETASGTYNSLAGTVNATGITTSSLIGTNRFFTFGKKNVIRTGAVSGSPFCAGASVSVPFTASGTYTSGNVFTAQLSDASGSFASPVTFGSITQTTAGTITATIPTATGTGTGYRIRVVSSNPNVIGQDNGSNLTINNTAVPIVGTITHPDCVTATGSVVLSGLPAGNWTINPGGMAGNTSSVTISGLAAGTYNFTVTNSSSGCTSSATANVVINTGATNTWTAGGWSQGSAPTVNQKIVFAADYSSTGDLTACSCMVTSGTVTFNTGHTLKLTDVVTVTAGTLTFNDKSNLVQINNVQNSGNITYKRSTTSPVRNTDYTYWSTPVSPLKLAGAGGISYSPSSLAGHIFYSYLVTATGEDWNSETESTPMIEGMGYSIRGPGSIGAIDPTTLNASFYGVPNNGDYFITIAKANASYLLGNPYPSAISADEFLAANTNVLDGTLYFWTHYTEIGQGTANNGSEAFPYTQDDYASYNITGGVGIGNFVDSNNNGTLDSGEEVITNKPNGKIGAVQGFFATSTVASGTIVFSNGMRRDNLDNAYINTQFFKTKKPNTKTASTLEKNRIWLNLTNTKGAFKQTLIGYITDATNNYDSRFDGESFDGQEFVDFYSINEDKNLTIQGRALPFDENDEVPLGFRSTIEGAFTISIDQADGSMTNQQVFIEDKLTNTVFDLRSGKYSFNTTSGTFNNRFVLRYTGGTLGTKNFDGKENKVVVSIKNKKIKINSFEDRIEKLTVYDLLGKQIYQKTNVNSTEFILADLVSNHQILLVKTTLQNGKTVTSKFMY